MAGRRMNPWTAFSGAWVPNWLMVREDVSDGAKLCYARLLQFCGRNTLAWPKLKNLAFEINRSPRQVQRLLEELRKHELIEWSSGTQGRNNRYYFLMHDWMGFNEAEQEKYLLKEQPGDSEMDSGVQLSQTSVSTSNSPQLDTSVHLSRTAVSTSPNSKDLRINKEIHACGGPGAAPREIRIKKEETQALANRQMIRKHRAEVDKRHQEALARLAELPAELREGLRIEVLRQMGQFGDRKLGRSTPENSDVIRSLMIGMLAESEAGAGKLRSA